MERNRICACLRHAIAGGLVTTIVGSLPGVPVRGWTADDPRDRSTPASVRAAVLEREVFELVNRHRRARGLAPLVLDVRIGRQARQHSLAMASGSRPFGHDGYEQRVPALRRATSCGDSAENVAVTSRRRAPASTAVRDWLASRGHRRNIEGRYQATGIGVASNRAGDTYFTQIFLGRCRRLDAR